MNENQNAKKPVKDPKNGKGGIGESSNITSSIKPTEIELPPLDPPVPNRAWTDLKTARSQVNSGEINTLTDKKNLGTFLDTP